MLTIDPSTLPGPAQKIVAESAPQKLRLMAAKGVVPGLRPDAILAVLVMLSVSTDGAVAKEAKGTLGALPEQLLRGALDADLHEAVLLSLAESYAEREDVVERMLKMPRLPLEAVEHLAKHGSELVTELVATNEERMLQRPQLIELIYLNPRARMSTANRLIELAVRHDIELKGIPAWKEIAQSIQGELIAEPSAEPLPEDEAFFELRKLADAISDDRYEDAFVEDEEGAEFVDDRVKPVHQKLAEMSVAEKIRCAMLGTREERLLLLRESNKIVAIAAIRSPMLQESEVQQISKSRGVVEDVLRVIGMTPEWLKSYTIKKNLVTNAKTPIAIATRLISQMREGDLRKIAKDKNVSGAVQQAARRHLERRTH
jgi:hypothetical protein